MARRWYFKNRDWVCDFFVVCVFGLFACLLLLFAGCGKKSSNPITGKHNNPIVVIKITGGPALYNYQIGGQGLSGHISGDQTFQVASNSGDVCTIQAINDSANRNIYIDITLSDGAAQYHKYGTGKQTIQFTSQ